MKFFAVVAVLACAAVAIAHPVSEEIKEQIKQNKKECIAETSIGEDVVKKALCEGVFGDDPKLADFFVCFLKKPGFINDAGEYQIETIKTKITEKQGEEVANKIVAECTKKSYGSVKENALHLAKCYHEHKPKHDHDHEHDHEKH